MRFLTLTKLFFITFATLLFFILIQEWHENSKKIFARCVEETGRIQYCYDEYISKW
jgi:hypothetical protein